MKKQFKEVVYMYALQMVFSEFSEGGAMDRYEGYYTDLKASCEREEFCLEGWTIAAEYGDYTPVELIAKVDSYIEVQERLLSHMEQESALS